MTPMQEPANMPREVMCHDLERKPFFTLLAHWTYFVVKYEVSLQASMVFQFQSICMGYQPPSQLQSKAVLS